MTLILVILVLLYILSSIEYFAYMFSQKIILYQIATVTMGSAFLIHTILLFFLGLKSNSIPVNNLHEVLSGIAWSLNTVFFVTQYKYRLKILGIYAAPIITFTMICSYVTPRTSLQNTELFQNLWLNIHVITIFLGDAALALACGSSTLYLIQENSIKNKIHGFFFKRLPSLDLLDTTGYACIASGFLLLTTGLITGSVYAKTIWGHFWSLDNKEIWSAITWLFYAIVLHKRLTVGWRGRKFAIMSIIGFAIILFTFLGVNFLLNGNHDPFTSP